MNTEDDEFARIAREQALNKMADNARELGLDYELPITMQAGELDCTHAERLCAELKMADQPAQQEPVACIIGTRGSAFDSPITKRAYTYKEQPGNAVAFKLGRACNEAGKQRAGDNIDRGLGLLQELQNEGFGVFALGAEYTVTQKEPVAFEEWLAKQHGDPWEMGFLQALRIAYIAGQDSITSPPQRKALTDVIKAAQGVLEWTEIAHRPPKRDRLEAGRMVMVRLHALADLHDALIAHEIKENI